MKKYIDYFVFNNIKVAIIKWDEIHYTHSGKHIDVAAVSLVFIRTPSFTFTKSRAQKHVTAAQKKFRCGAL